MDFDFALLLVVLTFATGVIWLFDRLFLYRGRAARAQALSAVGGSKEEREQRAALLDVTRPRGPCRHDTTGAAVVLRSPFDQRRRWRAADGAGAPRVSRWRNTMRPLFRSYGDISSVTRSPAMMRMWFFFILPDV